MEVIELIGGPLDGVVITIPPGSIVFEGLVLTIQLTGRNGTEVYEIDYRAKANHLATVGSRDYQDVESWMKDNLTD